MMDSISKYISLFQEDEKLFHTYLTYFWLGLAPFILILCSVLNAPYGRFHKASKFDITINGKLGWFIQEIISPVFFVLSFFWNTNPSQIPTASWVFMALWVLHYTHRAIIYPLRVHSMRPTTLLVVLSAVFFNVINGYVNGRFHGTFSSEMYTPSTLTSANTMLGIALFFIGMAVNMDADTRLINLRKKAEKAASKGKDSSAIAKTDYIPQGGLFEYVSAAHYFGEFIEWSGYAIATNSLPAVAFAALTFANLFPRAVAYHTHYQQKFGAAYPKERKAFFPFLF